MSCCKMIVAMSIMLQPMNESFFSIDHSQSYPIAVILFFSSCLHQKHHFNIFGFDCFWDYVFVRYSELVGMVMSEVMEKLWLIEVRPSFTKNIYWWRTGGDVEWSIEIGAYVLTSFGQSLYYGKLCPLELYSLIIM